MSPLFKFLQSHSMQLLLTALEHIVSFGVTEPLMTIRLTTFRFEPRPFAQDLQILTYKHQSKFLKIEAMLFSFRCTLKCLNICIQLKIAEALISFLSFLSISPKVCITASPSNFLKLSRHQFYTLWPLTGQCSRSSDRSAKNALIVASCTAVFGRKKCLREALSRIHLWSKKVCWYKKM